MIGEVPRILRILLFFLNIMRITAFLHQSTLITKLEESQQKITRSCDSWEFQCRNGKCIAESFLCDGLLDCPDGTDEIHTQCQNKTCNEKQFQCQYGACIENRYQCDGEKQCWDGSDELPYSCNRTDTNFNPVRNKRDIDGSCAIPAPSVDKKVIFLCRNKSLSCQPNNGYVPKETKALVTCTKGYNRDKEEEFPDHICNFDTTWRPKIKKCLKICEKLDPPNAILQCYRNGQTIDNCTQHTVLLDGTRIRPTCKPGYTYEYLPAYSEIICDENGKWDKSLVPCFPECGKFSGKGIPKISGGKVEIEGASPWHVAIFDKQKTLICGGTIIHQFLIISAAHCFSNGFDDASPTNVDDFEVVVAKHTNNYTIQDNRFQKIFKIKDIRYSSTIGYQGRINNHQADIAILILKEKITVSRTVLPACLNWMDLKSRKRPSEGELGKVVGWGRTEHGNYTKELKTIDLPVIDTNNCLKMVHKDFIKFITFDKFCAGMGNKTGPTLLDGDSGGGILFKENGLYYLRGIVSIKDKISNSVNLFTDLASHIDTISQIRDEVESNASAPANIPNEEQRPKTAADIAVHHCKKYAEYRFVNKWKNSTTSSQSGTWHKEMDCINVIPLITGGIKAELKEYPHMALIGYGNDFKNVEWYAGGSLISEKFVLSLARLSETHAGEAKWVLLGAININSKIDNGKPTVYKIVKRHLHPSYVSNSALYDISLFELNSTVTMSPYVRPACLYTSTYIPVNTKASITGWGVTGAAERRSENLLKATISVVEDEICEKSYEKLNSNSRYGYDSKTMICAGDLANGNDACAGDSGGPLQISLDNEVCMWSILGIVSYGSGICGNMEDPGVYTRVPYFLNWIQSIVWP